MAIISCKCNDWWCLCGGLCFGNFSIFFYSIIEKNFSFIFSLFFLL